MLTRAKSTLNTFCAIKRDTADETSNGLTI